jgi:hypothetical protein
MRLRFSLRLLFVIITVFAVALYWCVVRPTIIANQFVAAVNNRDFKAARQMLPDFWIFNIRPDAPPLDLVYAEVFPREWTDLRISQRRLIVRIARHYDKRGQHVEWTEDTDIVARPQGLQIETPIGINFQLPAVPINPPGNFKLNGTLP